MAGLTGKWQPQAGLDEVALRDGLAGLEQAIAHRGARSAYCLDANAGVGIGVVGDALQRRAAIEWTFDRRYLVAVAGTIDAVEQINTQVLPFEKFLLAVQEFGVLRALQLSSGTFCAAIWDARLGRLSLVRDRMGQADLYYRLDRRGLCFASELKALVRASPVPPDVHRGAVVQLLRYGYVPAPLSIYEGIHKLPAGSLLSLGASTLHASSGPPPVQTYWSLHDTASRGMASRHGGDLAHSMDRIERGLARAIARRAPAGTSTFLSGGIDSSLVASVLQRQSLAPIHTVSIGFEDEDHDELAWAVRVARHIGANNTAVRLSDSVAASIVQRLPGIFCEPYADSSQVPSLLAAELARQHSTHVLTGDGGDELFFGHAAYQRALRNARLGARMPGFVSQLARHACTGSLERARLGGVPALLAELRNRSLADSYLSRVSRWRDPAAAVIGGIEPTSLFSTPAAQLCSGHPGEQLLFLDLSMELPEGLMTKVDRSCMALGLQAHSPFLDPAMVQLAWETPFEHKASAGELKHVLKCLLERHLPAELVHRPKKGFGAPVSRWLRGPMREWAEDLLDPARLRARGIFHEPVITALWRQFIAGERKYHTHLWPVLMFQAWDAHWNVSPSMGSFHRALSSQESPDMASGFSDDSLHAHCHTPPATPASAAPQHHQIPQGNP